MPPEDHHAQLMTFTDLAAAIMNLPPSCGPVRLVAIDGPGGSGKSTFAGRLAVALGSTPRARAGHGAERSDGGNGVEGVEDVEGADGAGSVEDIDGSVPIVHSDDFAGWEDFFGWHGRFADQVLTPLSNGRTARYQRYDWERRALAEWHDVPVVPVVVAEGVGAARREFAHMLAMSVWVQTPSQLRLERGIARDGEGLRAFWELWQQGEREHYDRDRTRERADLVVDGTPSVAHDLSTEFVVISRR